MKQRHWEERQGKYIRRQGLTEVKKKLERKKEGGIIEEERGGDRE